jgi:amicyanin
MSTHVPLKVLRCFIPALLLTASLTLSVHAEQNLAANTPTAAASVRIGNFTFMPVEITIAPGTTVTWTNEDDIPHAVAASNKAFRSKVMDTEQHYSFTFTAPGTYDYFCSLHPHMQGKVIVK